MLNEPMFLYLACFFYTLSFVACGFSPKNGSYHFTIAASFLGLGFHTYNIWLRWDRVGHGPFINLYEILSSNLWSLTLGLLIFMLIAKQYRSMSRNIVPILLMLMIWLLITPAKDTFLPPTYNTVWLYFHVFSGKIFLSLLLLATASAFYGLRLSKPISPSISTPEVLTLSYRLLAFAFCFESIMLFFGAVWAQDAWGRYWAWDPLETWAFLTWMSLLFVLHWRKDSSHPRIYAVMVIGCFIIAFLTFFGVPFVSTAPHKGMI